MRIIAAIKGSKKKIVRPYELSKGQFVLNVTKHEGMRGMIAEIIMLFCNCEHMLI